MNIASTINRILLGVPRSAYRTIKKKRSESVSRLEALFFQICREIKPDVFIEAGAKDASTSRKARGVLPSARIVAFEANPFTFRRFANNPDNRTKRVEYLHKALSDRTGNQTFNVRIVNGRRSADGQGSLLKSKRDRVSHHVVAVPGRRLDEFLQANAQTRCAMWVDVEGASKEVLIGSENLLDTVDAIFIEVEEKPFWDGQWLDKDVISFLNRHGLTPVARDYQSLYQYNILFASDKVAEKASVCKLISSHNESKTPPITFILDKLASRIL